MRNKAYRRFTENLVLKRRKVVINKIKHWNLTDEQIKIRLDSVVNWMSNEWWVASYKKKCNRKRRHESKYQIKKYDKSISDILL